MQSSNYGESSMGDGNHDNDDFTESKDNIPIIVSDDEIDQLPHLPTSSYANSDAELLNFKLADIAMRFGVEKRNMVESQMLNLCISLEKRLLQRQL